MFKKFLSNNKILLTNLFLIFLIVLSYFLRDPRYLKLKMYLKAAGSLGLTCSVINWFALEILLEKISFLYTVDKIRDYMEPMKKFLIKDVFGAKNFDDLKVKYKKILTEEDKGKIEKNVDELGLNNIVRAFNNEEVRKNIKKNMLDKIFEIEDAIKIKLVDGLTGEEKAKSGQQFFKEEILPIIENKLEMSVLSNVQSSIYETIKNYFEWLVLWGAYCGAAFGLVFRFMGCL